MYKLVIKDQDNGADAGQVVKRGGAARVQPQGVLVVVLRANQVL